MIKGQMAATWKMAYEGVLGGMEVLKRTGDVHRAILHAVKTVEDNEQYVSVGYGGLPNLEGEVELDAAYMNGDTLGIGGIIAVKNIKNPIEVAFDLSKYKRNCLLAGEGAQRYASSRGFEFRNMLTEKTKERYLTEKTLEVNMEELEAYGGHDTVCVLGRGNTGTMACGVSTSGLFMKLPGRVGDSPLSGSGFYADSMVGCAAATGVGEDIMKGCLSFAVVERMRNGESVQAACDAVLAGHVGRLSERGQRPGSISVIAMDKDGNVGAATNKQEFPFVVGSLEDGCRIYVASRSEGKTLMKQADEQWIQQYRGD